MINRKVKLAFLLALPPIRRRQKLIGQTHIGASGLSGQRGRVQALVTAKCPHALFIHCYAQTRLWLGRYSKLSTNCNVGGLIPC